RPLLAELARFARPQARRGKLVAAGFAAALLGGFGGMASQAGLFDQACSGADDQLALVWSDATRARLAEVASSSGLPRAAAAWSRASAAFDAYGARWARGHGEACRQDSNERLDLRMA